MIASLSGTLKDKSIECIVLDVNGVGYELYVPLSTFYSIPEEGEKLTLNVYTYVKEDALKLFGFLSSTEKDLFIKLIGVSGVGPKVALSILSGMDPNELQTAIASADLPRLNAIPGVGKKTAERLILELKDKMKLAASTNEDAIRIQPESTSYDDAASALLNLGYKTSDIEKAMSQVKSQSDEKKQTVEDILREILKIMAK